MYVLTTTGLALWLFYFFVSLTAFNLTFLIQTNNNKSCGIMDGF